MTMKTMMISMLSLMLSTLSTLAMAETTAVASNVQAAVSTNVNQVLVEILSGVKGASGEIYSFSKQELGKAYDAVKEQAPQVITEFLRWRMFRSIVYIAIALSAFLVCMYIASRMKKYRFTESADDNFGRDIGIVTAGYWVLRLGSLFALFIVSVPNLLIITQILVAPRVYIIEYVIDLVK